MADQEVDTERVSVRAYVPRYQLEAWDEHAEELDMSRSEYVKAMVQAGRRGFLDELAATTGQDHRPMSTPSAADQGAEMETEILKALSTADYLAWEELLEAVTDDLEDRLEETLQDLQREDRVRYSGPNGGYTLDE